MIHVELLGRQGRSPWPKALLSVLVVCGGLYGIYHFFPALTRPIFSASSALIAAVQQEIAPQRETISNPEETQRETTPSSEEAQREAIPSSEEATSIPVQETAPKPTAQQEIARSATTQQEATPSPEPETASSPVFQPEATSSQAPSPQRSTACHQVMRVDEQVPTGIRVASLNCNSIGEYWLEGASPSYKALREFRLRLQALPSRVSFSTWWEERTLRFSFQGRFAERNTPPPAVLSSDQAEQFFGKVARWADASGLDSLSIHDPIHKSLSSEHTRQRQKLRGIGSPQQINAFLQQFQQAEEVVTLGEVLLMPVTKDENGWVQARLYAAVDIIVDGP